MALGDYMGASCHACIGGTNVRAEVQKLQMEAPHIIVGTPGRVFDMLNRRYLCECVLLSCLLHRGSAVMFPQQPQASTRNIWQDFRVLRDSLWLHC